LFNAGHQRLQDTGVHARNTGRVLKKKG
jgi:hypothetical protein